MCFRNLQHSSWRFNNWKEMERCCECWKGFSKTVQALIITGIVLVVIGIVVGIGFGASSSNEKNNVPVVPGQRPTLTFTNHTMADMCKYFFSYFIIRFSNQIFFGINFSNFVIRFYHRAINSQYFLKWTNANPMKILGQLASHPKLLIGSKLSLG